MNHINGASIETGDCLGFIYEGSQYGAIINIKNDWVTLRPINPDGFHGRLLDGKQTATVHVLDTWIVR